ncbi:MAG: plasmid pRiA4b ORF-3 family protein [Anaerolineae bacterium]|nr:plasmid pRiA4b ORF-3 family protein [Anaerolineae bacterium]NUQ07139.1 plasmid pRiA4b ORF-3 family protein [Anaerolineae bacterium]
MSKTTAPVFQIKITLRDSQPPIWRRVLVSSETKLSQLHDIIQTAMGWKNSHLHKFTIGVVTFSAYYEPGNLEELVAVDERYVKLLQLVAPFRPFHGDFHFAFEYEYDFGDGWMHDVVFEDVLDPDPTRKVPLCVGGERACPPEDVGGIYGYETFVEAIKNPDHPEHETYTEWMGREFDPTVFDVNAVNEALRGLR